MFDEPVDVAQSEDVATGEPPHRSSLRTRLAVAGVVVAAALGGLGVGVAWASDGDDADEPGTPQPVPAANPGCEGGGTTDTSLL